MIRLIQTGILSLLTFAASMAQQPVYVVDASGNGDFLGIQDAINHLPEKATAPRIILVKSGVYHEKVFIDKNFVTLVGEDPHTTELVYAQARDIWRCEHPDDWGVATLNLSGSDITIENLTIGNNYGFDHLNEAEVQHIDCPRDTVHPFKTVRNDGHQMALRSFATTRLIVRNCILRAYGGDTVSPWNTQDGMFYFSHCVMEGGVDFYCPRGWAYAEDCEFIAHGHTAAIWHDGSGNEDQKTVLRNCVFRGDDHFKLGRYHRDAQFYLIDCSFADNMADTPIYFNPSMPANQIRWGYRVYYSGSKHAAGKYAWLADNLSKAPGHPVAAMIDADWTFAGKWHPSGQATKLDHIAPRIVGAQRARLVGSGIDSIAERMLVYQRAIGGWPKAVNEVKVNYQRALTEAEARAIRADSLHKDPTIDNNATSREIRYLVHAYKVTGNHIYLAAAEKGIRYCLKAQYPSGGWPQYYPDSSLYRSQITYNDDAMINVLNILQDIVEGKNDFNLVDPSLKPLAATAVQKGISCILRTQIMVNGQLTAWCAQYNHKTFEPEMARKFELVSISGDESVGILRFLMRIPNPEDAIKQAIKAGVKWLDQVKISGYKYVDITAPGMPKNKDRVILPDSTSTIWARFYEIGTNRPFFSGRDSRKKYDVREIEWERRTGYGWYGTWPAKLLAKEYPAWVKKNLK